MNALPPPSKFFATKQKPREEVGDVLLVIHCLAHCLVHCLVHWLAHCLAHCLVHWLAHCLARSYTQALTMLVRWGDAMWRDGGCLSVASSHSGKTEATQEVLPLDAVPPAVLVPSAVVAGGVASAVHACWWGGFSCACLQVGWLLGLDQILSRATRVGRSWLPAAVDWL